MAVKNNLKAILRTSGDVSSLAKEVFQNFGKYLVEFFRMAKETNREFVREKVKINNIDYLKKSMERGKGVILLTAHIGNWELGGFILGVLGYPMVAIAMPHKERPVNDLFNKQREQKGVAIVPMQQAMRKCLAALRNNQIVALLADRDFTSHGKVLDFLGKKALIPKGAAVFAAKTGATILPSFLVREKDNNFVLTFDEPFLASEVNAEHVSEDVLDVTMKKYAGIIESKIRQYPTQWMMFRKFWISESSNENSQAQ